MRPPQLLHQFSLVAPWARREPPSDLRKPPDPFSGMEVGAEATVLVTAPIERSQLRGLVDNDRQIPQH